MDKGLCPNCCSESNSVHKYSRRVVLHYAIVGMEQRAFTRISFRCLNACCPRKTFSHLCGCSSLDDIVGRSRYTKSSKDFVMNKLQMHEVSYNSFQKQIQEDFGGKTSLSSLHKWVQACEVVEVEKDLGEIVILHTDEKHPSKKKKK